MDFGKFHFGRIEIDGVIYERDVVIDRGRTRKRKKKPSKRFREEFGHTPLSIEEEIPWKCQRLVVGTGGYVAPIAYVIDPKGRTAIEDKASVRSTLGRSPDLAEALMLAAGDADSCVDVDFQRRAQAAFAAATAARTSGPISDGPALGAACQQTTSGSTRCAARTWRASRTVSQWPRGRDGENGGVSDRTPRNAGQGRHRVAEVQRN